jgi:hypothetical protein
MSRIVIALVVALIITPKNGMASTPLDADLRACVSGLKAVESFVRKNRPDLNPEYFKAMYGPKAFDEHAQFAGIPASSMSDIKYCSHYNFTGSEINILMSHVYGFAPDNPENEISRCYSAFMSYDRIWCLSI